MIFTSLILRCSNYRLPPEWYRRFFSFRSFPLASNSYLLDVMDGNWSVLVRTKRCGECSLAQGVCSEMQEE
jgi:hypothetical protein